MPGVFGSFSRPSRALFENAWVDHADPVVAPPAKVFRASGTVVMDSSAFGAHISGASKREANPNLNPVLQPR
jgi:hypothetical protein